MNVIGLSLLFFLHLILPLRAGEVLLNDPSARSNPDGVPFRPNCTIRFKGEIDRSLSIVIDEINREADDWEKGFKTLCLQSGGGELQNVPEIVYAMGGKWITVVEENSSCRSACAWVFMGGGVRRRPEGLFGQLGPEGNAGRFLHYKGELAFHGPNWVGADTRAAEAYLEAIKSMESLIYLTNSTNWRDYQEYMEPGLRREFLKRAQERPDNEADVGVAQNSDFIPAALLFKFLTVPHEKFFPISTVAHALAWDIDIYGFSAPAGLTDEDIRQGCINQAWYNCVKHGQCWLEEGIGYLTSTDMDNHIAHSFVVEQYDIRTQSFSIDRINRASIAELRLKPPTGDEQASYPQLCTMRLERRGKSLPIMRVVTPFEAPAHHMTSAKFFETYRTRKSITDVIGETPNRETPYWAVLRRSTRLNDIDAAFKVPDRKKRLVLID